MYINIKNIMKSDIPIHPYNNIFGFYQAIPVLD